jgi:hypothetical protein
MTNKYFDARSLAEALGLSTDIHDWHVWLDQIPEEHIDFVRGKLVMKFGRLDNHFLPKNSIDYAREHIRNLELQLSHWLDSPEAQIDHFAISKFSARNKYWWWTDEHIRYWKARGKDIDVIPFCISLIPLCGFAEFSEFEAMFNEPVRKNICAKSFEIMPSERESLLECIESVCAFLNINEIEELSELKNLLRSRRVNQLLSPYGELVTNSLLINLSNDIEKMSSKEFHRLLPEIENQIKYIISAINDSKNKIARNVFLSATHVELQMNWRDQD